MFRRVETKGPSPSKRAAHAVAAIGSYIWVFGGNCNFQFFNDLHKICLENDTWEKVAHENDITDNVSVPSPRAGHTMEAYENSLIVFGGGNRTEFFDDLFCFDVATSEWDIKIAKVISVRDGRDEGRRRERVIRQ